MAMSKAIILCRRVEETERHQPTVDMARQIPSHLRISTRSLALPIHILIPIPNLYQSKFKALNSINSIISIIILITLLLLLLLIIMPCILHRYQLSNNISSSRGPEIWILLLPITA